MALGYRARTPSAANSAALGANSYAQGWGSVAVGHQPGQGASGHRAIAIGAHSTAGGASALAIGVITTAAGDDSVVLGVQSEAFLQSVAIGYGTHAKGTEAIAIGTHASARASDSIVIGKQAAASGAGGGDRQAGLGVA